MYPSAPTHTSKWTTTTDKKWFGSTHQQIPLWRKQAFDEERRTTEKNCLIFSFWIHIVRLVCAYIIKCLESSFVNLVFEESALRRVDRMNEFRSVLIRNRRTYNVARMLNPQKKEIFDIAQIKWVVDSGYHCLGIIVISSALAQHKISSVMCPCLFPHRKKSRRAVSKEEDCAKNKIMIRSTLFHFATNAAYHIT